MSTAGQPLIRKPVLRKTTDLQYIDRESMQKYTLCATVENINLENVSYTYGNERSSNCPVIQSLIIVVTQKN